jgi:RNA polymerase sigma-70 factor (sigma-E family)
MKPRISETAAAPVTLAGAVPPGWDGSDGQPADYEMDAGQAVAAIYQQHALGMTRLAFIMLGDRQAAEDVVQEAFCGLYRAWNRMSNHSNAVGYLRSSVLNGSRSVIRRAKRTPRPLAVPAAASAEAAVLAGEEQRETLAALRRLPPRQREVLVLRYFADLPEQETAMAMGVSRGTVKSTTSRALAALAQMLQEEL